MSNALEGEVWTISVSAIIKHLSCTLVAVSRGKRLRCPCPIFDRTYLIMPLPLATSASSLDIGGRTVLITGATGGVGRPLALACAAAGATVVLHGKVVRKLEVLYDEIIAAGGPEPTILPLDFQKAAGKDFETVANAIGEQLGRLDGVIHTANLLGSLAPIEHQSFDTWLKVLRVDVAAAMAITRAMVPLLNASSDASVTFTLDTRGQSPRAYWGAYAAAKAGVSALAAILADEWESRANLRVNAVVPGAINSPLRGMTHPGENRALLPRPEALVPLYLYLLRGQPKAESGAIIDAAAWLAGQPASTPLVPPATDRGEP
mgnify:FL=1